MGSVVSVAGWQPIDQRAIETLKQYERSVIVYSHSSKWDFVVYGLYWLSHQEMRENCRVLINPKHMRRWGWATEKFGALTSTDRWVRGGGATERLKNELSKLERFAFLISPKGSIDPNPWRSGYYHIAKDLDCYVVPAGFDYRKKKFIFKPGFKIGNMSYEEVSKRCKEQLGSIEPLLLHNLEYKFTPDEEISKEDLEKRPQPFGWTLLLFIVVVILVFLLVFMLWGGWSR